MTDQELREMDAEVHRVLTGHPGCLCGPADGGYDPADGYCVRCLRLPAPRYTTDAGDAWNVVCEMTRRFDRDPFICENAYLSGDREWHVVFGGKYEAAEATPMLAICKAALAAARR